MRKVLFILGQLSDDDVDWLARVGRRVDAAPGQPLITRGQRLLDMIVVLDGEIQVSVGPRAVARLRAGDILGEMSAIEDTMPSADAAALGPATLLLVPIPALRARLAADTGFAARFYKAVALFLAERMRVTLGTAGDTFDEMEELDEQVLDSLHQAGRRFLSVLGSAMGLPAPA